MTARLRPLTRILSSVLAAAIVVLAFQPGHEGHGGWPLAQVPAAFAQVSGWVATLTGAPAAPRPLSAADWDVVVHSRDDGTWRAFDPMQAEHGADCGPPTSTHLVTRYEDAVFQCRDHVMTAINAAGYGLVYLTPNQLVDFSKGEAVVRFDLSTFRASGRDWVDLWVTPFEDHHILPLDDWMPDLQGPPRRGIHIRMDNQQGKTMFRVERIDGHTVTDLDSCWWCVYEDVLAPSQSRRDTFELRISRTHVKFWMPNHGITWADASVADLGWDAGVVQFGHHSYNPTKDCDPGTPCRPGTWHWDNFSISPSVPFTMIRGDQRWVDKTTSSTVRFPTPAPAGAYLRLGAVGDVLQASLDGGSTWVDVRRQPTTGTVHREHFKSYWMPVPARTTRVDLRGQGAWSGDWMARDISLWSLTAPGESTPATSTPTTTLPVIGTPVPTPATRPAGCSARPAFLVRAEPAGPGMLRVTASAGTTAAIPGNVLRAVGFGRAVSGSIELAGHGLVAASSTVSLPPATREVTFTVRRTAGEAVTTVPLVLADECGEWQTFVGGGPGAF